MDEAFLKLAYFMLTNKFIIFSFGHTCIHEVSEIEFSHGAVLEKIINKQKRGAFDNFKFYLHYDESVNFLPEDKKNFIKNDLIPVATKYWEETLQVRNSNSKIKILRQCNSDRVRYKSNESHPYCVDGCSLQTLCGEVNVPQNHLEKCKKISSSGDFEEIGESGDGVANASFILYISAFESNRCSIENTVAYAAYCRLEVSLDRPVAGYVNMCPEEISLKMFDSHQMYFTIKHEILHALGFSSGLFAFYRDQHGRPLTPRSLATNKPTYDKSKKRYQWSDSVVKTVDKTDWFVASAHVNRTFHYIVTPSVVREVRNHFNCSTLDGAELENQGSTGTSITHWEKRLFENELMTGTYTQNIVISRITLALLEDTGWYRVNYDMAGDLKWGKNMGCSFATSSCSQWIHDQISRNESIHPYCSQVKMNKIKTECTEDLTSLGVCNLIKYPHPIHELYRNFQNLGGVDPKEVIFYGGSVPLADYCPYVQEFNWKESDKTVRGTKCILEENNPDGEMNFLLESYGKGSICIEHGSPWSVEHCSSIYPVDNWGSGCYQYVCDATRKLGLVLADNLYWCKETNEIITITIATSYWRHKGSFICPSYNKLCSGNMITNQNISRRINFITDHHDAHSNNNQTMIPCLSSCLNCRTNFYFIFYFFYLFYFPINLFYSN